MGLDIGFTLYEKKPFDEEGKLVRANIDIDDNWLCGWGKANESFGHGYFEFGEQYVVPVFQEELSDKVLALDGFSTKYKYVPFEDFRQDTELVLTEIDEEAEETRKKYLERIADNEMHVKELREEQRKCTEEQSYAFERWGEEIDGLKEHNEYLRHYIDNPYEDDDVRQAKNVRKLLDAMGKYLKESKYYVIPYFSC